MRPTIPTRKAVYNRDGYRCCACATLECLTFQHRRRVGTGGSKYPPSPVDGLTACATCNDQFENILQTAALAYGWKAKSWVTNPERVPVFYPHDHAWFRFEGTLRVKITAVVAHEMMHAVYGPEWLRWFQEAKRA